MGARQWALLAATIVSIIYGLTFTVAKDVMPAYIAPYGFIVYRVGGCVVLFWIARLFVRQRSVAASDFPRIIAAAFFGVALNMLTFFKGLSLTTPVSAAVLMVATPVIVLLLSAIIIREKIIGIKAVGILLGLAGTAYLILYGKPTGNASNAVLGNLLVFINAVSYGLYLILVKKLMDKYNAFVFVPWIYTFGFLMVLPFGWAEAAEVQWNTMPQIIIADVIFVVVFSTFLTYLLNLLSMRELQPTTVAVFIYLQPVFASLFAIFRGSDTITVEKMIAAAMIFTGVYLVTMKGKAVRTANES